MLAQDSSRHVKGCYGKRVASSIMIKLWLFDQVVVSVVGFTSTPLQYA